MAGGLAPQNKEFQFPLKYHVNLDNVSRFEIVGDGVLRCWRCTIRTSQNEVKGEVCGASQARENGCTLVVECVHDLSSVCALHIKSVGVPIDSQHTPVCAPSFSS